MLDRPIIARDISTVRDWLRRKRRGLTRAGLVGRASASRLRADGLETAFEFHRGFEWERWFLDRDVAFRSLGFTAKCRR